MKLKYDKEIDAAYIYLEDKIKEGSIKETIALNEDIILDIDNTKKIVGIEILNASKHLNKKILVEKIIA